VKCTNLVCDVCRAKMGLAEKGKVPSQTRIIRGNQNLDLCALCQFTLEEWIAGRKPSAASKAERIRSVMTKMDGVIIQDEPARTS